MRELGITQAIWINSNDNKVRDSHKINGQTVNLDEGFTLADGYKVAYPGDGDAAHSANCRCTISSVL